MTEWTSISVTEAQKDELEDAKPDGMAMGKFLVKSIGDDTNSNSNDIDREKLAEDRQEQLEEVVNGMCGDHATEESVKELADELRRVEGRIDDLENTLPRKTAEELR